ncbi:hypothetical protein BCR34DRAFT_508369 [Clohesyomyces aquaticus]|uniref:LYC1 C-terminal domain-containing protein n=1 Tax=Clohesyomyces aquaticus TaxID=1231657 RepID=A0A1Y1ZZM8_9PLEO|nr:hypothetical protein BCR34DRAFT_508369 [Clohesyomyces aquaticus]
MGSTLDLPSGTSLTLALVNPTPEEKLIQFKLNGAEWRGALSMPSYLRREEVLSNQSLTRDTGITYWILIDTAAKENALEPSSSARLPLASCETYRKKALVWQKGEVHDTITHAIGSVYCAPHLRGRGYAARMMQELGKVLRTHQTAKGTQTWFSVLFSDIGKTFYAGHGWEPFNSAHVSVPAVPSKAIDASKLPTARPLYEEDLADLCRIDEALIRKSLASRGKESKIAVALVPDIETIQWHHAREDFVGTEIHGKAPKVKGAMVGSEKGQRVWCYWTRVFNNANPAETKGNTLHILRLVFEDESGSDWKEDDTKKVTENPRHEAAITAMMLMAQREADEWNMEKVEAWNPSSTTLAAAQKLDPNAKLVHRDMESITSLKWFPPREGAVADAIDWISNEKYGWC